MTSSAAPFIGRDAELQRANTRLHGLEHGMGGSILILGETGVGKTRLTDEILEQTEARGIVSARAACLPLTVPMPLDPVITLLRRLGEEDIELNPGASRDLFGGAVASLRALATRPLVLVVDDLQWADAETIELISYAIDRMEDHPILWVVASRDEGPALALAHQLRSSTTGEVLRLRGLSEHELEGLARSVLGAEELDPSLVPTVHRRTRGNPFLSIELLRTVPDESLTPQGGASVDQIVPHNVSNAIAMRRAGLSARADDVLRWCSVLPEPTQVAWIKDLAGRSAMDEIPGLVAAGFLASDRGDTVSFSHAVVRDAVYESMLSPERVERHSSAADLLVDGPPEARVPQLVAANRLKEAAEATLELAEEALLRGGSSDAIALYRHSLDLARESELDAVVTAASSGLVLALTRDGRHEEANELADEVLSQLRRRGDPDELLRFLSRYAMALWDDAADLERAVAAVDEAEPLLASAEGRLLAEGALARAHILNRAARTDEALPLARLAQQTASELGNEALEARCLVHLGLIEGQTVGAAEGMETLRTAVGLARQLHLPAEEAYAWLGLSFLAQHSGDETGYEEFAREGLKVRYLPPPIEAMLRGNAAQGPVGRGELSEAVPQLEVAMAVAARAGRHVESRVAVTLAHAYVKNGNLERAREELSALDAPEGSWEDQRIVYARAFLAETENQLEEALELYRHGTSDTNTPGSVWSLAGVVRLASELGDLAQAEAAFSEMEALSGRWPVTSWLLPASRGYLAAARGDSGEAADAFDEAAGACGDAFFRTRLLLDAAVAREDRAGIAEAINSFDAMGATAASDRARAVARSLGMRPGRRREKSGAVSARERDVARLVAAGLTNGEIGAELYLSPRTVERHVGNLLTRHGYRSRTELAAAVAAGSLDLG